MSIERSTTTATATSENRSRDPAIPAIFYDYLQPVTALSQSGLKSFYLHDLISIIMPAVYLGFLPNQESISSIIKKLNTKANSKNLSNLEEYNDYMKMLDSYVKTDECKSLIEKYNFEDTFSPIIKQFSTTSFLVNCYIDMIHFYEDPNSKNLSMLTDKRIKASNILKKFPNLQIISPDSNVEIDGATALILYEAALKVGNEFIKVSVYPDGTMAFSEPMSNKPIERLIRYGLNIPPQPATIIELSNSNTKLSLGLYAAELLGYATDRQLIATDNDGSGKTTFEVNMQRKTN